MRECVYTDTHIHTHVYAHRHTHPYPCICTLHTLMRVSTYMRMYSCVNTLTGSMRLLCGLCAVSIYMYTGMCIYPHVLIRVSTYMSGVSIYMYMDVCVYVHTLTRVSTYMRTYSCFNTLTGSMRLLCRLCGVCIYICTDIYIYPHVLIRVSTYMSGVCIHMYMYMCVYLYQHLPHVSTYKLAYLPSLCPVGSFKSYVSFAKEPYNRDDILQKRPLILRIRESTHSQRYMYLLCGGFD